MFKNRFPLLLFCFLFMIISPLSAQEEKEYQVLSVAFYNLENLFDIYDDPNVYDDDRTPTGKDKWTEAVYRKKLQNMAYAIAEIGKQETGSAPVLLGVCEIENREVLEDLIKEPLLEPFSYGIIHFDSPDRRGIDVALLYQRRHFQPQHAVEHELILYDPAEPDKRIFTRDQLVVSGTLDGENLHILVNHWPSRSGGEKISSPKRENAAKLSKKIIDSIQRKDPYARIISMGDFNDDPHNKSLTKVLGAKNDKKALELNQMFNPMAALSKKGIGSLAYRDGWNLFDQILLSQPLVNGDFSKYAFYKAAVFNPAFLTTPSGQYRGYPFRSFGESGFTNGYSDHFPVYVLLVKRKD